MSEVNGSARAAEEFRLGVLQALRTIDRQGPKLLQKLKELETLYGEEPLLILREPFERTTWMLAENMNILADVLHGMQMYQEFLEALEARDKMGEDYAPKRETVIEDGFFAGKAVEVPTRKLKTEDALSFQGGRYRSIRTTKPVTLWRTYGRKSQKCGGFLTTCPPVDILSSKIDLALLQEWKNSMEYYCPVHIPAGTVLEVGKAGGQFTHNGQLLKGGADQALLMDAGSHPDWFGEEKKLLGTGGKGWRDFEKAVESIEQMDQ